VDTELPSDLLLSHIIVLRKPSAEQARKLGNLIGDSAAIGWSLAASYADIAALAACGTAIASCGLGDYEATSKSLSQILKPIANLLGLVGTVASLVIAAIILAREGRNTRAVEFLALAFTHPVGAAGWMEKWPLLARLCAELEQALGSGAYSAAWEQGKRMDVEAAMMELQPPSTVLLTSSQKRANQSLDEPLTERELEVLVLINEGLTNREIADQLFVGVSTVKKHINHIYSKLDMEDRSEAVNSARALHLSS
jgi:LuxR family maltose regulon positive regulatory protein